MTSGEFCKGKKDVAISIILFDEERGMLDRKGILQEKHPISDKAIRYLSP
ncbi:MAG: hypothetical protein ACJAYJ_002912 [Saprospiraceae bacterium]